MPDLHIVYDTDPLEQEVPVLEIGQNTPEELRQARQELVDKAVRNGLPAEHVSELRELVEEYADSFRVRLDDAPAADIPEMKVKLTNAAKPVKATPRKYNARQHAFIAQYCDKLDQNKLAMRIGTAECHCISPSLLVKKAPPDFFRFTVDLRGPNYATVKDDFVTPNLEEELLAPALLKLVNITCKDE
jgi:hypothetical protein